MNVLDLFSGIGGFSLGLERAGMRTVAFCEIEPYCRAVLKRHWPHVPCYDDVRTLGADRLAADGIAVDVVAGGFPCQDISEAGRGEGIDGARSGLWSEYARIIGELRPRYIIVENVSALLGRGLGRVLGDLAALGYDAEWEGIPASAIGAHHERDRIWIVAYPDRAERWPHAAPCNGMAGALCLPQRQEGSGGLELGGSHVADADAAGHEGPRRQVPRGRTIITGSSLSGDWQWPREPELDRVVDGLPNWSHRVASLGNAVVPQIPEIIGRAIMNAARCHTCDLMLEALRDLLGQFDQAHDALKVERSPSAQEAIQNAWDAIAKAGALVPHKHGQT